MTINVNPSLLFRFNGPNQVEWLPQSGPAQQTTLTEFAARAGSRRPILVLAGETVILTQAQLPGRKRAAWLKALPYALEEQFAEDVDTLHFALGPSAEKTPVAVIRHQTLQAQLSACAQVGLSPIAAIPDPLLLPLAPDSWSVLIEAQRAVVRCGPWQGFACEQEILGLLLELALQEAGEDGPKSLQWWGDLPPELATLDLNIQQQDSQASALPIFARGYQPNALDLLQGSYSRKAQMGRWLRPWRAAAILAGLWLGLQLVEQVSEYWTLNRERAHLTATMAQVYQEAVPQARKIVNPRVQLETRLRELRRGQSDGQIAFLDLLYQGGHQLRALEGLLNNVRLQGLRYNNGQLDLDLAGGSLEIFDQLKARLQEQVDLSAQLHTTKREGQVQSRLTLKGSTS